MKNTETQSIESFYQSERAECGADFDFMGFLEDAHRCYGIDITDKFINDHLVELAQYQN